MNKKYFTYLYVLIFIQFLLSCAPSRIVRPLEKGQQTISANVGGPLIGFAGTTIPMPLSSFSYAHGVKDNVTLFGGMHATAMLYGVFQTDIGACIGVLNQDSTKIGLSVNPVLNLAFDKWEGNFKAWPEIDVNVYWQFSPNKSFAYLGISNWFELASKKAHEQPQEHRMLINPHLGYTYVRTKWNYTMELKYLTPNIKNQPNVVDYKSFGERGGVGVYFNFSRKF